MNSNFNYNDDRFAKLSEKISAIQNYELKNPNRMQNVENKIDHLEINYDRQMKDLEYKYKFLEDEMSYMNKAVEGDKDIKENIRNKLGLEFKSMEAKIKNLFITERENMVLFSNNVFKNLENEINKIQNNLNKEKGMIIESVKNIKEFIEIDLPKYPGFVEDLQEERKAKITETVNSMNEELQYLYNLV